MTHVWTSILLVSSLTSLQGVPPAGRASPASWQAIPVETQALRIAPGWSLYPARPGKRSIAPHVVAARPEDRQKGQGWAVSFAGPKHFLAQQESPGGGIARVPSAAAAAELVRLLLRCTVIENDSTATRLREAAESLEPLCPMQGVRISPRAATHYGVRAEAVDGGFRVRGLFYSDWSRLCLFELDTRVGPDGSIVPRHRWLITGPATVRSTGEPDGMSATERAADQAKQQRLSAELELCRRRFALALDPRRSVAWIRKKLCREGQTMQSVRKALGPRDHDVGSGLRIWIYELHDGTCVAFGGAGGLAYVHHLEDVPRRGPGGLATGRARLLERLYPPDKR